LQHLAQYSAPAAPAEALRGVAVRSVVYLKLLRAPDGTN
jgi:hypothetical protein